MIDRIFAKREYRRTWRLMLRIQFSAEVGKYSAVIRWDTACADDLIED